MDWKDFLMCVFMEYRVCELYVKFGSDWFIIFILIFNRVMKIVFGIV